MIIKIKREIKEFVKKKKVNMSVCQSVKVNMRIQDIKIKIC